MTAIVLIVFSFLFYQLLIKPVLYTNTIPNSNYRQMEEEQNLMEMWRQLQQFKQDRRRRRGEESSNESTTAPKQGYQGGEYIDYEEL